MKFGRCTTSANRSAVTHANAARLHEPINRKDLKRQLTRHQPGNKTHTHILKSTTDDKQWTTENEVAVLDAEGGRPFVHGVKVYRGIGRNQDSRKPAWQQWVPKLILPPGGWGERDQAVQSVLQSFMEYQCCRVLWSMAVVHHNRDFGFLSSLPPCTYSLPGLVFITTDLLPGTVRPCMVQIRSKILKS